MCPTWGNIVVARQEGLAEDGPVLCMFLAGSRSTVKPGIKSDYLTISIWNLFTFLSIGSETNCTYLRKYGLITKESDHWPI